jgi:hypothetical protein
MTLLRWLAPFVLAGCVACTPANVELTDSNTPALNDVRLAQNTVTPGNGDERGFAFTIASNGAVSQ